jgi:predicted dehydrogenase
MVSAAEYAKQPLIEAFHYRYHALLKRAFAIAASGELGRLVEAEAIFDVPIAYRPGELRWIVAQGGGALMDLGCYCIHALRTLAACEPKVTSAHCTVERGVDAVTHAELLFPNGMTAKLHTSMTPAKATAVVWIKGEKGTLEIVNFVAPQNGGRLTVEIGGKTRVEPVDGPTTYDAQLAHVGDVLLRGAVPLTGGTDAVATMACIEAIYAAAGFTRG